MIVTYCKLTLKKNYRMPHGFYNNIGKNSEFMKKYLPLASETKKTLKECEKNIG